MKEELCYMCDEVATSAEHVPPKCLFPEKSEVGVDYRKNIITVPSCEKHNGEKSHDDEFFLVSIAGIIGNNSIGFEHYTGKVQRALKRTAYKFLDKVFLKKVIVQVESENRFFDVLWGTPDYHRLVTCGQHIAYGIYRHHFGANFHGRVKPYLGFLHSHEQNPKAFKELITRKVKLELDGVPKCGENQKIFYYQLTEPDEFGLFLVRLCFYENVDIYVAFLPEGHQPPSSLAIELMNRGIKTIIKQDSKSYEFN